MTIVGSPIYLWIKALHVISVIAWMAGMLYLPRLFVYHCQVPVGSAQSELFKVMERRLLKGIVNPAMIATWIFGLLMVALQHDLLTAPWLHAKLTLVVIMSGMHGYFAGAVRKFAQDRNTVSQFAWRVLNEVPAVLVVGIVLLVILKPF